MSDEKLIADILSTIRSADISSALRLLGEIGLGISRTLVCYSHSNQSNTPNNVRMEHRRTGSKMESYLGKWIHREMRLRRSPQRWVRQIEAFPQNRHYRTVPVVQSLRGGVFENMVHRYVCSKATSWRIKCLDSEKNRTKSDEFFQLPAMAKHHFTNVDKIDPHAYNIPLDSTFAGVDAILPYKRVLFQVTVSGQHPVKQLHLSGWNHVFQIMLRRPSNLSSLLMGGDSRIHPPKLSWRQGSHVENSGQQTHSVDWAMGLEIRFWGIEYDETEPGGHWRRPTLLCRWTRTQVAV